MNGVNQPTSLERMPTGIPGLDTILHGGFFRRSMYLISGTAGTGKTILAHQICFHEIQAGGRAVYITLLAETHGHLL
jgi:circadian clock protein KaiC